MTRRRNFPTRIKLKAWDRCEGADGRHYCECGCGLAIFPGDGPEYDHRVPAELGGAPSLENCVVLRTSCHMAKTPRDIRQIAKCRRQRAVHAKAKIKSRSQLPGSRLSAWKRALTAEGARWVKR